MEAIKESRRIATAPKIKGYNSIEELKVSLAV